MDELLHLRLHVVESGTVLEPLDLKIVVSVVQGERVGGAVGVGGGTGYLEKWVRFSIRFCPCVEFDCSYL